MTRAVDFKKEICALKGTHTARQVANQFGITRNAVIGIWGRNKDLCGVGGAEFVKARQGQRSRELAALRPTEPPKRVRRKPELVELAPALPPQPLSFGAPAAIRSLRAGECRFPLGDPDRPDFRFCCAPARLGRAYCPEHSQLAVARCERVSA